MKLASKKTWLAVKYEDKELVKSLSSDVRYDRENKLFFVNKGADLSKLERWLPNPNMYSVESTSPIAEFKSQLEKEDFVLKDDPVMDGKKHRVPIIGDAKGKLSGVYCAFLNGVPAGWYMNYKKHEKAVKWVHSNSQNTQDPQAMLHIRASSVQNKYDAEIEQQKTYDNTAQIATKFYYSLILNLDALKKHSYFINKNMSYVEGMKIDNKNQIIIPITDINNNIRSIQRILPDGTKLLQKDSQKLGNFFKLGGDLSNQRYIAYAEGVATASSINQSLNIPVITCIDANNLIHVATQFKKLYPNKIHVFFADDDYKTKNKMVIYSPNKGVKAAVSAAKEIKGFVIRPRFNKEDRINGLSDFNDIHHKYGLSELTKILNSEVELLERKLMSINSDKLTNRYLKQQGSQTPIVKKQPENEKPVVNDNQSNHIDEPVLQTPETKKSVVNDNQSNHVDEPVLQMPETKKSVVNDNQSNHVDEPVLQTPETKKSVVNDNQSNHVDEPVLQMPETKKKIVNDDNLNENIEIQNNAILVEPRKPAENLKKEKYNFDPDLLLQRINYEVIGDHVMYKLDNKEAFIDFGDRLEMASKQASSDDEKILAAVLVAKHHYSSRIELTGSDEFKKRTIDLIALHNIHVSMKNPIQQAQLDEAIIKHKNQNNNNNNLDRELNNNDTILYDKQEIKQVSDKDRKQEIVSTSLNNDKKIEKVWKGTLIAHGEEHYNFDKKEELNYFIKLNNNGKDRTLWGIELQEALKKAKANIDDEISIKYLGKHPVTINKPIRNDAGKIISYQEIQTHRNSWNITNISARKVIKADQDVFNNESLSAYNVDSFTSIQNDLVSKLNIQIQPINKFNDTSIWLNPNGTPSNKAGDTTNLKYPTEDKLAGEPIMKNLMNDGSYGLYLVKAHGDYLQGVANIKGEYKHILAKICKDEKNESYITLNTVSNEGLNHIGYGRPINTPKLNNGESNKYDMYAIKLNTEKRARAVLLQNPENIDKQYHKFLGFKKPYEVVNEVPKQQPRNRNQPVYKPAL